MRIVTYNLRYDSKPDDITLQQSLDALSDPFEQPKFLEFSTEQPWSTRRIRVAEHLLSKDLTFAGFQEALVRQVNDLAELLGPDWSWIGVGRGDGGVDGEFNPIFFKNSNVELISEEHFWLSNTPFTPSTYPGAGSKRICTVGRFSINSGNGRQQFTLLNTHLDDRSDDQRQLGASMLLHRARFEAITTGSPVLMTGDFNSESTGDSCSAYKIVTGAKEPVDIPAVFLSRYPVRSDQLPSFKLLDLRGETPRRSVSANYATFTGFTRPNITSSWARLDFIFGGNTGGWTSTGYKVDTALSDDGILASDHRPVFADLLV